MTTAKVTITDATGTKFGPIATPYTVTEIPDPVVTPPPASDIKECSDFAVQGSTGFPFVTGNLAGKGRDVTVYRMKPGTSTKKASVDALTPYASNMNELMRWWPANTAGGADIGGLTVAGTNQNHPYNGVQMGRSVGMHVHDVRITGIPGFSSSPPGETMALSLWHADHAVVEDVICDGRVDGTGTTGVAATLFGTNYVSGSIFRRCTAQYANTGFGSATFECTGETWEDSIFANNRKQINIERTFGGTFAYTRCKFSKGGVPYVAQVSTDPAYGSAKVIFTDCTVDGDGILRVRVYGPSSVNSQKDSDIRCIKGGVDVTGDPTKFQLVRSG